MLVEELKKEGVGTCKVDNEGEKAGKEKTIPELLESYKNELKTLPSEFSSSGLEEYEELEKAFKEKSNGAKQECKSLLGDLKSDIGEYKKDLSAMRKIEKFSGIKGFSGLKDAIKSNSFGILEEDIFDLLRTSSPEEIRSKIDGDNTLSLPVDKDSFIRLKKALDSKNTDKELKAEEGEKSSNNGEISIEDEKVFNSIEKEFLSGGDLLGLGKENFTKSPKDVILGKTELELFNKNYFNLEKKVKTIENLQIKFPNFKERFNSIAIIFNNTKRIYDEIKSNGNDKGNENNNKSVQEVNQIAKSNDLKTLTFLKNQGYLEGKQFEGKSIVYLINSFQENYDKLLLSSGSFDIKNTTFLKDGKITQETLDRIKELSSSKKALVNFLSNPKNLSGILAAAKKKDEEIFKKENSQTTVGKAPTVQQQATVTTSVSASVNSPASAPAVPQPKPTQASVLNSKETTKKEYKHYNEVYNALVNFDPEVASALKNFESPSTVGENSKIPSGISEVEKIVAGNVLGLDDKGEKSKITFGANENILVVGDKDGGKVVANFENGEPNYSLVSENGFSVKMNPGFESDEKVLEVRGDFFQKQEAIKTQIENTLPTYYKLKNRLDELNRITSLTESQLQEKLNLEKQIKEFELKINEAKKEAEKITEKFKKDMANQIDKLNTEREKTKARNLQRLYEETGLAALPRNIVDDIFYQIEVGAIIPDLGDKTKSFNPINIDLDRGNFGEPLGQGNEQKVDYLKALVNKMFTGSVKGEGLEQVNVSNNSLFTTDFGISGNFQKIKTQLGEDLGIIGDMGFNREKLLANLKKPE